jgi:TetR/AcrR family transcriptional repressor of mexJK operon
MDPKLQVEAGFTPKRGRPTKEQVSAIDQSILDVARQLFLSEGYANTAMDTIATSAGVSKGTLYARYADKPALFRAVVSKMLDTSRPLSTDELVFGSGPVAEQMYRFGSIFLERMLTPDAMGFDKVINAEAHNFPELALEFAQQGYEAVVRRLSARIDATTRDEGWPASDPHTMAKAYVTGLTGWVRQEARTRALTKADCDAYASRLVALLVGGRPAW